jgi:hypothetical protein
MGLMGEGCLEACLKKGLLEEVGRHRQADRVRSCMNGVV